MNTLGTPSLQATPPTSRPPSMPVNFGLAKRDPNKPNMAPYFLVPVAIIAAYAAGDSLFAKSTPRIDNIITPKLGFFNRVSRYLFEKMPVPSFSTLRMYKGIKNVPSMELKMFGLSLEDLMSRISVLFIYIPQTTMAFTMVQKPMETLWRNFSAFFGTFGVVWGSKHPKYGLNSPLNQWMVPHDPALAAEVPQGFMSKLAWGVRHPIKAYQAWANTHRPINNYLSLYKEAGGDLAALSGELASASLNDVIHTKSFWSAMDVNERNKMDIYLKKLQTKLGTALAGDEAALIRQKVADLGKIAVRTSLFKYASAGLSTILFGAIIGIFVPKIVIALTSGIDKRLETAHRAKLGLDTTALNLKGVGLRDAGDESESPSPRKRSSNTALNYNDAVTPSTMTRPIAYPSTSGAYYTFSPPTSPITYNQAANAWPPTNGRGF